MKIGNTEISNNSVVNGKAKKMSAKQAKELASTYNSFANNGKKITDKEDLDEKFRKYLKGEK